MPRYAFWISDRDSIEWTLPHDPQIGELLDFLERGRWRIVAPRVDSFPGIHRAYDCSPASDVGDDERPINLPPSSRR